MNTALSSAAHPYAKSRSNQRGCSPSPHPDTFNMARTTSNSSLTSSAASDASLSYLSKKPASADIKPKWNSSTKASRPKPGAPATSLTGTSVVNVNDSTSPQKPGPYTAARSRPSTPSIRPATPSKRPSTPLTTDPRPPPASAILASSPTKGYHVSAAKSKARPGPTGLPPAAPPGGLWTAPSRHRHAPGRHSTPVLAAMYETHLNTPSKSDREVRDALKTLRRMIVENGLPDGADDSADGSCSLRGRIWKILLGIYRVSAMEYVALIAKGASDVHDKIRNDTFRTLATDRKFLKRVDEGMLSRVLNAFVWKVRDRPVGRLINLKYSYVQGMNVQAAPFLYVMPELDAFYSFASFIQNTCPLYVQPALEGVHCGLKLMDKCLKVADAELYRFLKSKKLNATVYAFPSIMTFCACTQPLDELCRLWDFLFAYGVHINVLCVVVQIVHIRHELLQAPSPMRLLRTLPDLNARKIIEDTLRLIPLLHEDLYDMLVRHPFDPTIHDVVLPEREGDDGDSEDSEGSGNDAADDEN
ncbi:hypothetical protein SeLEV6574_g07765 [Synchytrium endobioticum]|uniref:Rab-GAP TBC domain-containing protein n=1 Tax=Synchytrium endobioticum TaxID=286115 RepID=A0A507CJS4_9FUNG|nr:hypothetical protein SeLEV6574_g07765 [Synchytrium endobioticum]